jgi:hypothetical protein
VADKRKSVNEKKNSTSLDNRADDIQEALDDMEVTMLKKTRRTRIQGCLSSF